MTIFQPNIKYSLFLSVSGMVKYYDMATEYTTIVQTRTPFLEFVKTKFKGRLRTLTDNRIDGNVDVHLNDDLYALYVKGRWKVQINLS